MNLNYTLLVLVIICFVPLLDIVMQGAETVACNNRIMVDRHRDICVNMGECVYVYGVSVY